MTDWEYSLFRLVIFFTVQVLLIAGIPILLIITFYKLRHWRNSRNNMKEEK